MTYFLRYAICAMLKFCASLKPSAVVRALESKHVIGLPSSFICHRGQLRFQAQYKHVQVCLSRCESTEREFSPSGSSRATRENAYSKITEVLPPFIQRALTFICTHSNPGQGTQGARLYFSTVSIHSYMMD